MISGSQVHGKPHLLISMILSLSVGIIWMAVPHPLTGLVISLLPITLLFALSQTFWLVSLFIVFSFFRVHEVFPMLYPLKIPLLLSAGALASLLWHTTITQSIKLYWHPCFRWLFLFWGLAIVGVVFAANRDVAIAMLQGTYWKIMVMTLAVAWLITSDRQLSRFSLLMVLSGLLVATVAIYNSVNGIGLVEGSRVTIGRDFGSMLGDPNDLALVLMFPLGFSISVATTRSIGIGFKVFATATSLLLFMAIIATQSRGGLLGALAVTAVFAWRIIPSKTLLVVLGITAALALFAVAGISERASGGSAEQGIDASAMGRIYAWEAAFKMALDNPLFGVGLNNFYYNYFFYSSHWDGLNHAVHSTWFGVLAETGFVGLIVFIGFCVSLITTSRKTLMMLANLDTPPPFLLATALATHSGLIGTIVSGTFLTQGFNWPIYILAGLTISASHIASQIENPKNNHDN